MEGVYDLVICADGFQPAQILAASVEKGLKVALVTENGLFDFNHRQPFAFSEMYSKKNLIFRLTTNWAAAKLQKSAPHLLTISTINHYKRIGIWDRVSVFFQNILKPGSIKLTLAGRRSCLKYKTYRYSTYRLGISLIRHAIAKGAVVFQHFSLVSSQHLDNGNFLLSLYHKRNSGDLSLYSRALLLKSTMDLLPRKKEIKSPRQMFGIVFSLPQPLLNMQNIDYSEIGDLKMFLVPWFGHVYGKIISPLKIEIEQIPGIILNHFDYQIDIKMMVNFKQFEITLNKEEEFVFHTCNRKKTCHFKASLNDLSAGFRFLEKVAAYLNPSHRGKIKLDKLRLPGYFHLPELQPLRIMEYADEYYDLVKQILQDPLEFKKLFYRYGSDIELIIDKAFEYWNLKKDMKMAWLKAEIWFCTKYELCHDPESFIHLHTSRWMKPSEEETSMIGQIFCEMGFGPDIYQHLE